MDYKFTTVVQTARFICLELDRESAKPSYVLQSVTLIVFAKTVVLLLFVRAITFENTLTDYQYNASFSAWIRKYIVLVFNNIQYFGKGSAERIMPFY